MKAPVRASAILLALIALTGMGTSAQDRTSGIWAIDFVKPKDGQRQNYLKFIEDNWLKAREEAKQQGFIASFKVLVLPPPGEKDYEVLLVTEYPDRNSYLAREEHFKAVFAKIAPAGPRLINGLGSRQLADITSSRVFTEPSLADPR